MTYLPILGWFLHTESDWTVVQHVAINLLLLPSLSCQQHNQLRYQFPSPSEPDYWIVLEQGCVNNCWPATELIVLEQNCVNNCWPATELIVLEQSCENNCWPANELIVLEQSCVNNCWPATELIVLEQSCVNNCWPATELQPAVAKRN